MPDQIKDGTGQGFLARVDQHNKLEVHSTKVDLVHFASTRGDAYILPMLFTQQSAGVDELAGTFTYTGKRSLIFHVMTLASHDPDLTVLSVYGGTTPAGGGIAVTPLNLNTNSSKTLLATILHMNDGANLFTPYYQGAYMFELVISGGGMYQLPVFDAFIIRPNVPLGMYIKCTNAGSKVRPSVTCYEYDLEI